MPNNAKQKTSFYRFDVCVTVHLRYNSINNQVDATITIY